MSTPPLLSGPIPPQTNPPIMPEYFQPSNFDISAVLLGTSTLITTSSNHNYVIAQLVRLIIPNGYGCRQLNEKLGYVVSIPSPNQVLLSIDTSMNCDQFIAANLATLPQINALGDVNNGLISNTGPVVPINYIPGSFQNISPL
jgi:hypothetical protein